MGEPDGGPQNRSDDVERLLAGESAEVIARLKEQLAAEPEDANAWLQLGVAYMTIEHWGLALSALSRAVEHDDEDADARLWLARVLLRLRRPDKAVYQLVQAKRLAPDDARVAHELGVAFYDKGLFDKALAELDRARALDPKDARARYSAGLAHEAKRDMAQAIACYREAARIDPQLVEARKTLVDALAQMGELDEAIAVLRELVQLERQNPQNAINLEALEARRAELAAARLMGKGEEAVAASALVRHGGLAKRERVFASPLAELHVTVDGGVVRELVLLFPDPAAAARASGEPFGVTVLATDGTSVAADYATAASLTFLREALGASLTQASELYARLLASGAELQAHGCRVGFGEITPGRPALRVASEG